MSQINFLYIINSTLQDTPIKFDLISQKLLVAHRTVRITRHRSYLGHARNRALKKLTLIKLVRNSSLFTKPEISQP